MTLSRRSLLALAGTGAVLAEAVAQTPVQTAAQEPASKTPEERLTAAREDNRQSAERLTKVKIPMSTEPAFQFKA